MHSPRLLVAVIVAVGTASAAAGAPPIAPSPDASLVADPTVEPTSLTVDVETGGRAASAPLPLSGPSPARGAAPPRPLPDWRLLAALGGAFAVLAGYRMIGGRRTASLPPDVFEVLGEASLGGQQTAKIVRFGPRTLLVGISSAGCQTLAELTDAHATESIVTACRGAKVAAAAGRLAERRKEPRA
jgi:hypothetical protein